MLCSDHNEMKTLLLFVRETSKNQTFLILSWVNESVQRADIYICRFDHSQQPHRVRMLTWLYVVVVVGYQTTNKSQAQPAHVQRNFLLVWSLSLCAHFGNSHFFHYWSTFALLIQYLREEMLRNSFLNGASSAIYSKKILYIRYHHPIEAKKKKSEEKRESLFRML